MNNNWQENLNKLNTRGRGRVLQKQKNVPEKEVKEDPAKEKAPKGADKAETCGQGETKSAAE